MNPVPLSDHPSRPEDLVHGRREGRLWVEWRDCLDSTNLELMRRPALRPMEAGAGGTASMAAVTGTAGQGDGAEKEHATASGRGGRTESSPFPTSECMLSPVWLMAGRQTAGRGRRGKPWQSQPGHTLTASLGCELPPGRLADVGAVPLVAGIVIAEYLATLGVDVMVKWPNDLCRVLPGPARTLAKVGGILCEMRTRSQGSRLVIGAGLNLQGLPDGLVTDQPVAALFDTLTGPQSMTLALGVGQALLAGVEQLLAEGFGAFSGRWQFFDALAGRAVRVHHAEGPRDATALGIDAQGGLQVRYDDAPGHLAVLTAEQVSIRPRAAGLFQEHTRRYDT